MSKGRGFYRIALERLVRDKIAMVAFGIIVLYAVVAILAGLNLIARNYDAQDPGQSYQQPGLKHLMGTDIFGRSVFQRVVHGAKISMSVGLITSLIAVPIGIILGAIAGYFGGIVDEIIVWIYSVLQTELLPEFHTNL